jgi:ABC-type transport system involved in cytochrome bd biosynthesis fused ATPase/permease subunit
LDEPEQNIDLPTLHAIMRWLDDRLDDRSLMVVSHAPTMATIMAWDMHIRGSRVDDADKGRTLLTSEVSSIRSQEERDALRQCMNGDTGA